MQPSAGLVLGHRYSLTDRIAVGGMGEVWVAEDEVLGRTVAVKMLRAELLEVPGFVERLRAEARHAAGLAHTGIAGVYDYGEDASGAYLVMELVPGHSLSELLADQPIPPLTTTLSILAQTAEALDAAHRGGVVHRDIKPGNIMVLPNGAVKVTDFGIAKVMDGTPANHTQPMTAFGQVIGTPQYMSPEQIAGQPATAAADIYSLGVIGHEMLRGERPFTGDNPLALAMAHAHQAPPPLPESVPPRVRALIERAMSKKADDRPPTAAAFACELRALQMGVTPPPSLGPATVAASVASATPTGIMPPGGVAVGAPLLVVDEAALDGGRRSSRRFAMAALVVVAGIAALLLLVRLGHNGSSDILGATQAAVTSSVVASEASVTTATEAPTTAPVPVTVAAVLVDPQTLIGLSATDAVNTLKILGLEVETRTVKSDRPVGTVVDVSPSGALTPGSNVTVSISGGRKGKGND